MSRSNSFIAAMVLPVIVLSIVSDAATQDGARAAFQWNLRLRPSAGHTGNLLLAPGGQVHEGPGSAGPQETAYHLHRLDRETGVCESLAIPLDSQGRLLRDVPAAAPSAPSDAVASVPLGGDIERMVVAGDWGTVVESLGTGGEAILLPVVRFILGHALLALNRNNESLLLFVSSTSDPAIEAWTEWTSDIATRHPGSSIAHYLQGDALARKEKWSDALSAFSKALEIDPGCHLALCARGVVFGAAGKPEAALEDLYAATILAPRFADSHASLGTYWIHRRVADGALQAFKEAIRVNPDFTLAMNGRACALAGQGKWDEARELWLQCTATLVLQSIAVANITQIADAESDSLLAQLAAEVKQPTNAGTTIAVTSDVRLLSERIAADLPTFTQAQIAPYVDSLAREHDMGTIARAFDQAQSTIGAHAQDLCTRASELNRQLRATASSPYWQLGWGDTLDAWGTVASGFGTAAKRPEASLIGLGMRVAGRDLGRAGESGIARNNKLFTEGDTLLREGAKNVGNLMKFKATLTDPTQWGPGNRHYFALNPKGTLWQDKTATGILTSNVPRGVDHVCIISDNAPLTDVAAGSLRQRGVGRIDVVQKMDMMTMRESITSTSYILDLSRRTPTEIGGVTTDISGAHVDRGNWEFRSVFGLGYSHGELKEVEGTDSP